MVTFTMLPASGRKHVRRHGPRDEEHPEDVRLDDEPPRLGLSFPERLWFGHEAWVDELHPARRVVDEDVDPAVPLARPLHQAAHVVLDRDIGLYSTDGSGQPGALARHPLGFVEVPG